ncbi:MAG: polyprenyl synthetase family protein [Bacteroidales bacterium]|nr:polyprenyl synthetase family protein [Bacteroidales bacterium]
MITEEKIESSLKALFDNLEFTKEPAGLYDPLRYMISISGKRLRPRLCLTTYGLFKDEFTEEILQPAAALEVFHNFTLIHDDIMDKSPLRRGVPTVWVKWKEDTAILSGDVMLIDAYQRVAKAPAAKLADVFKLFSDTAAQVCDGQQFDMDFENRTHVAMSEYMDMIGLKTGVLIACAAKMGALIAGASEQDCKNLYDYAYTLGLAFQVSDDYLDAYGDVKVFGKPIGGDIVNNKKCWLTTRAIEKADEALRAEIIESLDMPVDTDQHKAEKIAKFMGFYDRLGIREDALAEIQTLNEKALSFASRVNVGDDGKAQLAAFANRLIGRTK